MTSCTVCGVTTHKTREPLARNCSGCGKALCNAHTHYYVDGQNVAITNNAPPLCAACYRVAHPRVTKPAYEDAGLRLWHGDNATILPTFADETFDSVITDPPYELGFMGKGWDSSGVAYDVDRWRECFRVLKPGGYLLAFGGSRTWHRVAAAIEDAGFEIRDSIAWLYGSGFPKSLDVSKAIDKAAGAEREKVRHPSAATAYSSKAGNHRPWMDEAARLGYPEVDGGVPATPDAERWQGWGTALKPAFEPIVVARKPLIGTVAANVLEHGTGALNIDATRTAFTSEADRAESVTKNQHAKFGTEPGQNNVYGDYSTTDVKDYDGSKGRWPSNVVLDGSQADELDAQTGTLTSGGGVKNPEGSLNGFMVARGSARPDHGKQYSGDSGGASRFFPTFRYEAKAPTAERPNVNGVQHPTVKPLELMRWLCRLVTPKDGTILEPFAGSGTTLEAALLEGFNVIGIEREAEYLPLIEARITKPMQPAMFGDWDGVA